MSKKYPAAKSVKFILCEDVREEAHSKLTFLGVFTADSITLLRPQLPTGTQGVAVLASLAIVVILKGIEGDFETRMKLMTPDKKVAFEGSIGKVKAAKASSATLAWKVQGFVVTSYGCYHAELRLDDKVYPFDFDILDGTGAKISTKAA